MLNLAVPSAFSGRAAKVLDNAAISLLNACVQLAVLSTMNSTFGKPFAAAGLPTNKSTSSACAEPCKASSASRVAYFSVGGFIDGGSAADRVILGLSEQHAHTL